MRPRRRIAWTLFVVWTILTCASLLLPVRMDRPVVGAGFDKVVHTVVFTGMGMLAQVALPWLSLFITLPLAAGLEFAQLLVPYRGFELVDLYANLIGVVFGTLLAEAAWRLRR